MKIKTSGSLVYISSEVSAAANEDRVAEDSFAEHHLSNDSTAGWNPYDVWRTRVKLARDSRNEMPPDDRRR